MIDSDTFRLIYRRFIEPNFDERCRFPVEDCIEILSSDRAGGNFSMQFDDSHCLIWADMPSGVKTITFMVVDEPRRSRGLGSDILKDWEIRHGHPRVVVEAVGERAANFWRRNGYHEIKGFNYVQPPLMVNQEPDPDVIPMVNFEISAEDAKDLMKDVWKYSYGFTDEQIENNISYFG